MLLSLLRGIILYSILLDLLSFLVRRNERSLLSILRLSRLALTDLDVSSTILIAVIDNFYLVGMISGSLATFPYPASVFDYSFGSLRSEFRLLESFRDDGSLLNRSQ